MNTDNILLIKKGDVITQRHISDQYMTFESNASEPLECFLLVFKGDAQIQVNLKEEGATCLIQALYLIDKDHKANIDIKISHLGRDTKSSQIIKGIATDQSKVSFFGNIYIDNNAQKSDGYQNHRALLLSDDACVQAVPALEIYADDVKCSHGSATGPLDENALFYLLSRGISSKSAKKILLESFVSGMIPTEYNSIIQQWIEDHV